MINRDKLGFIGILCTVWFITAQELTISSSNEFLVDEFNTAKQMALDYVVTGDEPGYIPAYWGSYPIRECFCSRDICHQAEAGHLLGLDLENFSMLKTFASDAPESNEYWPKWSYDFYGNPYFMDADFKELPAPFEIVEKIYEQYLWTGDPNWIWDDTLFTYCENTVTHFVNIHDQNQNGIVELHTDLATYWEQETDDFIEAGDSFANQYRAVLAFAGILAARGDQTAADEYYQLADDLQNQHASDWFDETDNIYIRGFDADGNYKTDFGHENSFFMPMKLITDLGPKTKQYVEFCHKSIAFPNGENYTQWDFNTGINIEAKTYLSQMAYYNNRIAIGWHWLLNIMNSNSDYPEVPFLIVGHITAGMMGLTPDAPNHKITTLSKLNYEVPWLQADHIALGENTFSLRHDGQTKSTLTNAIGSTMIWEAQFYSVYENLLVDGQLTPAEQKSVNGANVSFIEMDVSPGQSITIEIPEQPISSEIYLSDFQWESASAENGEIKRDVMSQGYAMSIDGNFYDKGLSGQGNTEIIYNLDGQFFRFTSDYGIDDSKTQGSAIFEVWADGTQLFTSGMIHSSDELQTVDLNVSGVNQLMLKTTDANSWDGICDWGNARVHTDESPILSVAYTGMTGDENDNGEFDPGESGEVHLSVENLGITSEPVWVICNVHSDIEELITIEIDSIHIGILESYQQEEMNFNVQIDPAIPRGTSFTLEFVLSDGVNSTSDDETFFIPAPNLHLDVTGIQNDDNGNGIPEPGETFELHLTVENEGNYPSQQLFVNTLSSGDNAAYLTINNPVIELNGLIPGAQIDFNHSVTIDPETPRGTVLEISSSVSDGEFGDTFLQSYTMPYPNVKMEYLGYTNDSNGNGVLEAGESAEITLNIENNGTGRTDPIYISAFPMEPYSGVIEMLNPEMELGILESGASLEFITTVQVQHHAPDNLIFYLTWEYTDGLDFLTLEKSIGIDVLWLSDAFWSYHQNGWGETGRDMTVQGLPITLNGVVYEKGLGLHAVSETHMDLNGRFTRFISDIGVDDEVSNGAGSVEFYVFTDGIERYNSGYMDSDSPTQTIDLDVTDVNEIILMIDESTFGISSDHADWAGAYFTASCSPGDINLDGILNILDIVQMVQCILGSAEIENCGCADINGDDTVNVVDIVLTVNEIIGN